MQVQGTLLQLGRGVPVSANADGAAAAPDESFLRQYISMTAAAFNRELAAMAAEESAATSDSFLQQYITMTVKTSTEELAAAAESAALNDSFLQQYVNMTAEAANRGLAAIAAETEAVINESFLQRYISMTAATAQEELAAIVGDITALDDDSFLQQYVAMITNPTTGGSGSVASSPPASARGARPSASVQLPSGITGGSAAPDDETFLEECIARTIDSAGGLWGGDSGLAPIIEQASVPSAEGSGAIAVAS